MKKISIFSLLIISFSAFYGCDACFTCQPVPTEFTIKVVNNQNEPLANYPVVMFLGDGEQKQNTDANGILSFIETVPIAHYPMEEFVIFADSTKNCRAVDCILLPHNINSYSKNTINHTIMVDSLVPIKVRIKSNDYVYGVEVANLREGISYYNWEMILSKRNKWYHEFSYDSFYNRTKLRFPIAQVLQEEEIYATKGGFSTLDTVIIIKGFAKKPFIINL